MRALLIVLESLGVGRLQENDHPSPNTPNTLAQLFREVPDLELPTFFSLGLGEILKGRIYDPPIRKCAASYGRMIQRSAGPDFLSSLWELAGVVLPCPFASASQLSPEAIGALSRECGVEFLLQPAGGGPDEALTKEHLQTGKPMLTLEPGSGLRLTVHEKAMPKARLAQLCRITRRHATAWRIARVEGVSIGAKTELASYPIVPPRTLFNAIADRGLAVEGVGGIPEAFARSGITRSHPSTSQTETLSLVERLWRTPQRGKIICAHLNALSAPTPKEQARALEEADNWLANFLEEIDTDSLLLITGSNSSRPEAYAPGAPRQEVPILLRYGGRTIPLGLRESLADAAATLSTFFGIHEQNAPWSNSEPLITFHRPKGFNGPWESRG